MNKIKLTPLTRLDQITVGDKLLLRDGNYVVMAKANVLHSDRISDVEVVFRKNASKFFSTQAYLDGQSWVKECFVVTVEDDEK